MKYQPFAASAQLTALEAGASVLRKGKHGAGVRLVQGGLMDLGYKMSRSIQKSGAPDGMFGNETVDVVSKFQADAKLGIDGVVGKVTLARLDSLLAQKASPPPPVPPPVPPAPVSLDYMIGAADPPRTADPGAGAWNSRSKEATYVALRAAITEVLPAAVAMVGDDAVAHMWHYFNSTGRPFRIDLSGMIEEVPSAKVRYAQEVYQAKAFVEALPPGAHAITSRNTEKGYNTSAENKNWYYAIGGYVRWGVGQAIVTQGAQSKSYELDYTYKFYDRYNWDQGKSVTIYGVKITDHFMGEFHRQGLAREFDCFGSVRRRFTWKEGQLDIGSQLSSPVTTERGA